ncbi:hypothetical protein [Streptomyces sp. NPDC006333]|uniref:hypothetical protein n=1 Tax=Streptomyces sp. NPDC006333 TaxID=3156753 RepID=UPI0033B4311D
MTEKVRRVDYAESLRRTRRACMTRRSSADEAVGLLEGELGVGRRALADLSTEDAWRAFLRFGRRLFDVPDTPDTDGLLFQYGTYSFDGPPTFTLDLTRQFEIADSDGDHDHYVQVLRASIQTRTSPAGPGEFRLVVLPWWRRRSR